MSQHPADNCVMLRPTLADNEVTADGGPMKRTDYASSHHRPNFLRKMWGKGLRRRNRYAIFYAENFSGRRSPCAAQNRKETAMAFTGRKHTPETKAKMARARRTYWGSEAAADRRSKVTLEEVLLIHNLRCEGKTWKQVADSHDETMVAVKSRYYAALHSKDPKFDALREAHGKNAERVNREDD